MEKEKIIEFIKKRYNPNKDFVEIYLSDLFDFFGITDKDIIDNHERAINKKE